MPKNDLKGSSVALYTWGTHRDGGNGVAHFLDASFFGGNVGHAAIELTLVANHKNQALVQQYCLNGTRKIIPFELTTQNCLDEQHQLKQQEVYKIYFSWWPGEINGYDLKNNLNTDSSLERFGVDTGPIDARFINPNEPNTLLQKEKRTYHGPLGSRIVHLANHEIAHLTSLSPEQKALLTVEGQVREYESKLQTIVLIEQKLAHLNDKSILEGTLLRLLQELLPEFPTFIKDSKNISAKNLDKIKSEIDQQKQDALEKRDILVMKRDILKGTMQLAISEELQNQINAIRETLNGLSEPNQALALKNRAKPYSQQAWIQYELQETDKQLETAQLISIFLTMNPFSANKEKMLNILFDQSYPNNPKDIKNIEQWRQFLPKQFSHIQRHEMTPDIYAQVQKNANAQKDILLEKQTKLYTEKQLTEKTDPFFVGNYERHVQRGHAPDNTIRLPISGFQQDEHLQAGLNAEKMLAKMRDFIKDDKHFHLATKNCSVTTGGILAAGADPSLRSYFKAKAWGGFGNPQEVYNGALKYQHTLSTKNGEKSFGEKLSAWNPLNAISWLGGKMLNKVADPETSLITKMALGIALIPMTGLAAISETIKAFANPKKSVQNGYRFMNYAWHTSSTLLKICTIPVGLFTTALAIPAALQYGVQKAIVEPLAKTTQDRAMLLQKEASLHPKPVVTRVKLGNDKLAEVDDPNPVVALATLQLILKEHPDRIPVFSAKTQRSVNEYLKSLDHFVPSERTTAQSYETSVKQIYARTKEMSLPSQRYQQENNTARHESLDAFRHHQKKENKKSLVQPRSVDVSTEHRALRPD